LPIVANIRQIDTLCTVNLRRVQVPRGRQNRVGMVTYDIPEELAQEAIRNTSTQEEAGRYVMNKLDAVVLQWPESTAYGEGSGSTPTVKCGPSEREGSN